MLLRGHGGSVTAAQREALEQAAQSCDRLNELLAGMSDLARLAGGRLALAAQVVEVGALLADAASTSKAPAPHAIKWSVRPPRLPCAVTGDRRHLARALRALAIAVTRGDNPPAVVATGARVGDEVVITLSGTPRGIDPSAVEPLETLDDLIGGLGLELPLARAVVEAAGGRLGVPAGTNPAGKAAVLVLPVVPPERTAQS
jgi:signal transduction histidine kinase